MESGTPATYSAPAISLHWLVFLLVLAGSILGLYMVDLPLSPHKLRYYSWHKWIGVTIFLLAAARLVWRIVSPPPPLPDSMPQWQKSAAAVSHTLLYILILAIPVSGWLFSSASGVPTVYLGLVQLPDLVSKDKALADFLQQVHYFLNRALLVIVCIHVAKGTKVLARMLPFLAPRPPR